VSAGHFNKQLASTLATSLAIGHRHSPTLYYVGYQHWYPTHGERVRVECSESRLVLIQAATNHTGTTLYIIYKQYLGIMKASKILSLTLFQVQPQYLDHRRYKQSQHKHSHLLSGIHLQDVL